MSDPISVTSTIITLVSQATKAQEKFLTSQSAIESVQKIVLDINVNLHKFQAWQETWSGQAQQPNVTSEALWGVEGWANVRKILNRIDDASKQIELCLNGIQEHHRGHPKWLFAVKSLRTKKRPQYKLQELATALSKAVDELWIYSETVFDSLHGVMTQEPFLPARDELLTKALQSRAGSLQLYGMCAKSTLDCSLAMDLVDERSDSLSPSGALRVHSTSPMHLFYQLYTQTLESPTKYQKLIVENVRESDLSATETAEIVQAETKELQLFQPKDEMTIIEVSKHGPGPSSYLRIPRKRITKVSLRSSPEKLTDVLDTLQTTSNLSAKEHLSIGAKIQLAYKIVESGFFLLGTPWFSSLSTRNLLRLKSRGRERHSFMLEIQTLDFVDLLFDDPDALTETAQLFRLGILLMEIALERTDFSCRGGAREQELDVITFLPEVEQAMGGQYCKATAFCLQHRLPRPSLRGPERYSGPLFEEWERYLVEFLHDYHSQVFLRYALCIKPLSFAHHLQIRGAAGNRHSIRVQITEVLIANHEHLN